MAISQHADLAKDATAAAPARNDAIPHVKILISYIGLLCLGKSDFEAIEAFRHDPYFAEALAVDQVPSAITLRQRLDTHAAAFMAPIVEASIAFLQRMMKMRALARELLNDWNTFWVVLDHPELPLTNNKAERALRHWVIARPIGMGTRATQGTSAFAHLASIIETCRKRAVSLWPSLAEVIRQRRQGLQAPPLPSPAI